MYKLYYTPGSCSTAVHVILNELNVPYEIENLGGGKNRSPEYLKINPLGQVPALALDDGRIINEGAAILIHLLEKHHSPLLPTSGKERDQALEALMFCNATLHPAYGRGFFLNRNISDEKTKEAVLPHIVNNINQLWEEVESRLNKSEYLAGDKITVADILITVIANWSGAFPGIKIGEKAKELFRKIIARPAFKKAMAEEGVEYKAAN
jgi:glutathione S-transferase